MEYGIEPHHGFHHSARKREKEWSYFCSRCGADFSLGIEVVCLIRKLIQEAHETLSILPTSICASQLQARILPLDRVRVLMRLSSLPFHSYLFSLPAFPTWSNYSTPYKPTPPKPNSYLLWPLKATLPVALARHYPHLLSMREIGIFARPSCYVSSWFPWRGGIGVLKTEPESRSSDQTAGNRTG